MKSLQDKHVLVLGLGLSGLALARWCLRCGAQVTVADTREAPPQLAALRTQAPEARFISGAFSADLVQGQQAVFKSPGLAPAEIAPVVDAARAIGLHVGNELTLFAQALAELAEPAQMELYEPQPPQVLEMPVQEATVQEATVQESTLHEAQAGPALPEQIAQTEAPDEAVPDETAPAAEEPLEGAAEQAADAPVLEPSPAAPAGYRPKILAITGTNGKTTVTTLTGLLVERAGRSVAVAGNIGPTLLDTLTAALDADRLPEVWVLELSSFQLDEVSAFEASAATVLNITQDHLDWHGTFAAYAKAKANVYGRGALMLLNREDPLVMAQLPVPEPVKGKAKPPRCARTKLLAPTCPPDRATGAWKRSAA